MRLEVSVSLASIAERRLHVTIEGQSLQDENSFRLEALGDILGVKVLNLKVEDGWRNPVQCNISNAELIVPAKRFTLNYDLHIDHTECMGADRNVDMMYPFINDNEVFFGVGSLPVPTPLPQLVHDLQVQFHLTDVPAGWGVVSNEMLGQIEPVKLEGYFIYAAAAIVPVEHVYLGKNGPLMFELVVQNDKTIPQGTDDIWEHIDQYLGWAETYIAPFVNRGVVHILMLQAPRDFEQQMEGRAFATGENVPNGIITYAPQSPDYLWKMFEHDNYAYFLEDGLAHELTHFYTTSSWTGRAKSVLYPSPACPPEDARLIGEYLNQFCYNQFMYRRDPHHFFTYYLTRAIQRQQKLGGRSPILDLFLLDTYLRRQGHSVLTLFGVMVWEKERRPGPYDSGQILFKMMDDWLGLDVPSHIKAGLLGKETPNYVTLLEKALLERGYALYQHHGFYEIRRGD